MPTTPMTPMAVFCRMCAIGCLLLQVACSEDPMEACMQKGLGNAAESGSRGDYIKAREKVRAECERRLN